MVCGEEGREVVQGEEGRKELTEKGRVGGGRGEEGTEQ